MLVLDYHCSVFSVCSLSSMFRTLFRAPSQRIGNFSLRTFATSPSLRRPIDMEKVDTSSRLEQLRGLMKENKVDIYSAKLHSCEERGR